MARGHIRPHGDAWRLYVYAGTDPVTGKRQQKTRVVQGTRKDAEAALADLLGEVNRGQHSGSRTRTLGHALQAFIAHKAVSLEVTTVATYKAQLAFIPDRLKDMPVGKVDVEHLEALYAHLRKKGRIRDKGPMTPKSVRHVHQVIHGALELAKRRKWITVNPAAEADVPADRRREPTPTPADAIVRIMRAAAACHVDFPAYVRLSACAGGRRSEIHGLRWGGVDWERRTITIADVVVWADGAWQIKPYPKSGGHRRVMVDGGTIDVLREVQARALDDALAFGVGLSPKAFVFSDHPVRAEPWKPRTTAKWFQRACKTAGVDEGTRLHDLRHLAATHLVGEGLPLPAVSGRLGHASPSITLDVYSGRVPKSDEVAADIMGRLLDG